ncbi:hypothetical protein LOAG_02610 [Loa loa]|uniref:Uncharacterized protein n=1 Tax=Loa loa TaxID=7209 RepID=A0A1S0U6C5_LOALO|nr:hypothetical protein LOAG_02610 [Loa loa]EFO25870.1 hypothetical protein LOAG_02610 [Loa loa]
MILRSCMQDFLKSQCGTTVALFLYGIMKTKPLRDYSLAFKNHVSISNPTGSNEVNAEHVHKLQTPAIFYQYNYCAKISGNATNSNLVCMNCFHENPFEELLKTKIIRAFSGTKMSFIESTDSGNIQIP